MFACKPCGIIFSSEKPECPICKGKCEKLCDVCGHVHRNCSRDIHEGYKLCPQCGHPVCPECGSFDVEIISRVTGYLQAVSGWNAAKRQELLDRKRADL